MAYHSRVNQTPTAAETPQPFLMANPLRSVIDGPTVEWQPYGEAGEIVSTFGVPPAEYSAVRKATGLIDLPQRGIIEVTGPDRHAFLNNLLTNQLYWKDQKRGLPSGEVVYGFFLSGKGRVFADANVIELGERSLLELDARMVKPLLAMLQRYHFAEKVKFAARLEGDAALHEMALHGPGAADVVAAAGGAASLGPMHCAVTSVCGVETVIWRDDACGVPGIHLVAPTEKAEALWRGLVEPYAQQTNKRTLRPVGWAAYNACRIEAGRAMFGIDFDDTILPAETSLEGRAVSFTKGCYLGQEVVARMHARQQVARKIVGLRVAHDAVPIAGQGVYDAQQNVIGTITSSTFSPVLSNAAIALALVKKPHFAPGTVVRVPAEGAIREATVTPLPFLPPADQG